MFNKFAHFDSNFINFGSIVAFLALNGRLSTDENGNRFLVNSKNMSSIEKRISEFEDMKYDIFWSKQFNTPFTNSGNTYYVDATLGDDNNDGLSELTAWKTLSKVNNFSFNAGDAVLFKRGEVWEEKLTLKGNIVGGTINKSYIGAYGTDLKQPIISGNSVSVFDGVVWVDNSDGTFTTTLNKTIYRLFEDGEEILKSTDLDLEPLSEVFRWYISGTTLTVYGYDTTKSYSATNLEQTILIGNGTHDLIIQDIDAQGGIYSVFIGTSNNISLRNITIGRGSYVGIATHNDTNTTIDNYLLDSGFNLDYSMGGTHQGSTIRGASDGINLGDGISGQTITNGVIKNWLHASYNSYGSSDKNTFKRNYCTAPDAYYGGRIVIEAGNTNFIIEDNYIYDIAVRNQLGGSNNTFKNNIIKKVRLTPLKPVSVSQGLLLQPYSGDIDNLSILDNIFIDCYDEAIRLYEYDMGTEHSLTNCLISGNKGFNCGNNPLNESSFTVDNKSGSFGHTITNNNFYNENIVNVYKLGDTILSATDFNEQCTYSCENNTQNKFNIYSQGIIANTGGATKLSSSSEQGIQVNTPYNVATQKMSFLMQYTHKATSEHYLFSNYINPRVAIIGNALRIYVNGSYSPSGDEILLTENVEYDIAVIFKFGNMKLYVNNELKFNSKVGGIDLSPSRIGLGSNSNVSGGWTDSSLRGVYVVNDALVLSDLKSKSENIENFFSHCNNSDTYNDLSLSFNKSDVVLNMPLNEVGEAKHDYATNTDYTLTNYTTDCDVQGLSTGLQKIAFDDNMIYTPEQMNFYAGDAPQYIQDLSSPLSIKETLKNGTVYLWLYDGIEQKLYKDGIEQANSIINAVRVGEISRLNGETIAEIADFELFNIEIKYEEFNDWLDLFENLIISSNDDIIIASSDGYVLSSFDYYILESNDSRVLTTTERN